MLECVGGWYIYVYIYIYMYAIYVLGASKHFFPSGSSPTADGSL